MLLPSNNNFDFDAAPFGVILFTYIPWSSISESKPPLKFEKIIKFFFFNKSKYWLHTTTWKPRLLWPFLSIVTGKTALFISRVLERSDACVRILSLDRTRFVGKVFE